MLRHPASGNPSHLPPVTDAESSFPHLLGESIPSACVILSDSESEHSSSSSPSKPRPVHDIGSAGQILPSQYADHTPPQCNATSNVPPKSRAKPLVVELCAGTARVTASLIELGFEAIAVDHKRAQGASAPTMIADLTSSEGSSLVTSWLQLPECIGFFAAPPCGTCSRAREITSVPGPPPLRTDEEPDGVSSLQGVSFERALRRFGQILSVGRAARSNHGH